MKTTETDCRATYEELETFLLNSSEAGSFDELLYPEAGVNLSPSERRKSDRTACDDSFVELEGLDGEWLSDSARVVNASPGGVCLESHTPIDAGTMLMIWFETESGLPRYALGLVVHRNRKGRAFQLGVQFTDSVAC
jgi:hypothetical protein